VRGRWIAQEASKPKCTKTWPMAQGVHLVAGSDFPPPAIADGERSSSSFTINWPPFAPHFGCTCTPTQVRSPADDSVAAFCPKRRNLQSWGTNPAQSLAETKRSNYSVKRSVHDRLPTAAGEGAACLATTIASLRRSAPLAGVLLNADRLQIDLGRRWHEVAAVEGNCISSSRRQPTGADHHTEPRNDDLEPVDWASNPAANASGLRSNTP